MHKPIIKSLHHTREVGSYRTGELTDKLTVNQISDRIGFGPMKVTSDSAKVKFEWSFTVNDKQCAIWDYKGSKWSVYDPHNVLKLVFPEILAS